MFWRKNKNHDEQIIHESSCKRNAFRYYFDPASPLKLEFQNKTIRLINLSAVGMSFINEGFTENLKDRLKFELDIPNYIGDNKIDIILHILQIDNSDICHCIFEKCSEEQSEIIHKYLLEMQKKDLKDKKNQ